MTISRVLELREKAIRYAKLGEGIFVLFHEVNERVYSQLYLPR